MTTTPYTPLLLAACAAFLLALPGSTGAQPAATAATAATAGEPDPARLAKLRERVRTDRKALVQQNLPLTDAEAKAFWPVYDGCHASIEAAQRKANRAIVDYVGAEGRLTDANAVKIVREALAAENEAAQARRRCFERVAKVLPGRKAARYLQIETKLGALARFDVAATLPLAE
jgi:hypothetical protein